MTLNFNEYIAANPLDSDSLHQALQLYLAELTDDLSNGEMVDEMRSASADSSRVAVAIRQLKEQPELADTAALAFLGDRWESGDHERVKTAIANAKSKLPVIELGIVATVAMYALFLMATGGRRIETTTIKRSRKGTRTTEKRVEYFGPTGPLRALTAIFSRGSKQDTSKKGSGRNPKH